ncbi:MULTISPECIES: hypothetical protein [unclassified Mesorhizobium]|nr:MULTISPECIES: hypothetical protein [unclassified Mesorhizobium]
MRKSKPKAHGANLKIATRFSGSLPERANSPQLGAENKNGRKAGHF